MTVVTIESLDLGDNGQSQVDALETVAGVYLFKLALVLTLDLTVDTHVMVLQENTSHVICIRVRTMLTFAPSNVLALILCQLMGDITVGYRTLKLPTYAN